MLFSQIPCRELPRACPSEAYTSKPPHTLIRESLKWGHQGVGLGRSLSPPREGLSLWGDWEEQLVARGRRAENGGGLLFVVPPAMADFPANDAGTDADSDEEEYGAGHLSRRRGV